MPKLMNQDDTQSNNTPSNFAYSNVSIDNLTSPRYSIVQILLDESGSVGSFKNEIEDAVMKVYEACKKSPDSENLLIRVATFTSPTGINEVHGFLPINGIDASQYKNMLNPRGCTPLCDAAMDSIETVRSFGKQLVDQDYLVNAIIFVITDGEENSSTKSRVSDIKNAINLARSEEVLDSINTILVGINDVGLAVTLDSFRQSVGFDQYISVGDANPGKLAKLANFVSQSISSTSQVLGTGGPSKPVSLTF